MLSFRDSCYPKVTPNDLQLITVMLVQRVPFCRDCNLGPNAAKNPWSGLGTSRTERGREREKAARGFRVAVVRQVSKSDFGSAGRTWTENRSRAFFEGFLAIAIWPCYSFSPELGYKWEFMRQMQRMVILATILLSDVSV
jgi:hypothetical protein